MTKAQNIKAILECNFAGFKEEIIDIAVSCIMSLDQEPCGDAINRQAALKLFATHNGKYLFEAIRDLPSVTPSVTEFADKCRECGKQRTGHWINHHIIANRSFDMIVCSECGEEFSYDAETGISEYNYCPNCGCRMFEPQESEG